MDSDMKTLEPETKPTISQPDTPEKLTETQKPACAKRLRFEDPGLQMLYESDERIKKFNLWVEELQPGCIFTDVRGAHYEYIGMCEENYLFRHAFNAIFTSVEHCDSGDLSHMVNVDIPPQMINFYISICGQKIQCNSAVIQLMFAMLGLKKGTILNYEETHSLRWENCYQIASLGHESRGCFPVYTDTKSTRATYEMLRWMMRDFQVTNDDLCDAKTQFF